MNLRNSLIVAALIIGTPAFVVNAADTSTGIRTLLQAYYHKMDVALDHRDADGASAYTAPDAVIIGSNGKTATVAQSLASLRQVLSMADSVHGSTIVTQCSLSRDGGVETAMVTVKQLGTFNIKGPNGNPVKLVMQEVSRDRWVKLPSGWLIEKSQAISDNTTVNGQKIDLNAPNGSDESDSTI